MPTTIRPSRASWPILRRFRRRPARLLLVRKATMWPHSLLRHDLAAANVPPPSGGQMSISTAQIVRTDRAFTALQWARELATPEESGSETEVSIEAFADSRPARPGTEEWLALSIADVRAEVDQLMLGRRPDLGLDALLEMGFLDAWLPEISAMVGFGDGEFRHKDVWKHTKQVVWQSVPRINVRWGAL